MKTLAQSIKLKNNKVYPIELKERVLKNPTKHKNKLDKLKKIQLAMVTWLDNNKDKDGVYQSNSTWKERMTYVLNCEKKDLDKDDIKMLNNLWKHYGQ